MSSKSDSDAQKMLNDAAKFGLKLNGEYIKHLYQVLDETCDHLRDRNSCDHPDCVVKHVITE